MPEEEEGASLLPGAPTPADHGGSLDRLEDLPTRERIAPPEDGEKRARRHRSGRGRGGKPGGPGGQDGQTGEKRPEGQADRQRQQGAPQVQKPKPQPPKASGGTPAEGDKTGAARRRPHHRGGRRRNGGQGGGPGGSTPKTGE